MKKVFVIIMAAMFCLAGCENKEPVQPTEHANNGVTELQVKPEFESEVLPPEDMPEEPENEELPEGEELYPLLPLAGEDGSSNILAEMPDNIQEDWKHPYLLPENADFDHVLNFCPTVSLSGAINITHETTVKDLINIGFSIKDSSAWDILEAGDSSAASVIFSIHEMDYMYGDIGLAVYKLPDKPLEEQKIRWVDTRDSDLLIEVNGLSVGDSYAEVMRIFGPPSSVKRAYSKDGWEYWTLRYNVKRELHGLSKLVLIIDLEQNVSEDIERSPVVFDMALSYIH